MKKTNLLWKYLKLYGNSTIAYSSALDSRLHSFYLDTVGFVIYGVSNEYRFILGKPLCAPDKYEQIIKAFVKDSERYGHALNALQVDLDTAKVFHKLGYNANHMGVETILHLDSFNLQGKSKNKIRRWINASTNAGLEVREENFDDKKLRAKLKALSDSWLESKTNHKELALLTSPFTIDKQPDTRLFCAYLGDELAGFNVFEPMYEEDKIIGYYANINRIDGNAPNGASDLIQEEARKAFKEEGCKYFSFGLSPLSDIDDSYNMHNPLISELFKVSYKYGDRLYSFKGLDFHKKAYHDDISSERKPMFMISQGGMPIFQCIEMLAYIGITPNKSFASNLLYLGVNIANEALGKGKEKAKSQDMPEIVSSLMSGVSVDETAGALKHPSNFVKKISNALSAKTSQVLENINSSRLKLYFEKHLNKATEFIFIEVSEIANDDPDIVFVHDIAMVKYGTGYYVNFKIELDGNMTVFEMETVIARVKKLIMSKHFNILGVFIEPHSAGEFARRILKIGLENATEEDLL